MKTNRLFLPIIPIVLLGFLAPLEYTTPVANTPEAVLTGNTSTIQGIPVEDVDINIEGDFSATAITGFDGSFIFSNIPDGSSITITPSKSIEPNGTDSLSVADVVLVRRAILFIEDFTSPCETIAADVNSSTVGATAPLDGVTSFDQVLISQVILGESNMLTPPWKFIPADANVFTGDPIPQNIMIDNATGDVAADFLAIRSGNVTGCTDQAYIDPTLIVVADPQPEAPTGFTIDVPIVAFNFTNVAGLQFSIEWDPAVLSLAGPNFGANLDGLSASNFGFSQASDGRLRFLWIDFFG